MSKLTRAFLYTVAAVAPLGLYSKSFFEETLPDAGKALTSLFQGSQTNGGAIAGPVVSVAEDQMSTEDLAVEETLANEVVPDKAPLTAEQEKQLQYRLEAAQLLTNHDGAVFAYIIKPGDTIWGICNKFPVDEETLRTANPFMRDTDIIPTARPIIFPVESGYSPAPEDLPRSKELTKIERARPLFDLIAQLESSNNPNRAFGHKSSPYHKKMGNQDFTSMSLNEILAWQKAYVKSGSPSSAVGSFQIINKTMKYLIDRMDLKGHEIYDEDLQKKMAYELLKIRGYEKFLDGKVPLDKFMVAISKEWASFPKDMSGRSYYAGDGLNVCHVKPEKVRSVLKSTLQDTQLAMNNFPAPR